MELSDLRAFLLLAEHGSFQQAAASARMSRGGLRRQIDRLEEEVGVPLVRRGARGVELSRAGVEVAERAAALLREADQMVAGARRAEKEARGVLRFIVPTGWPTDFRCRALVALRGNHPGLDVHVVEDEDPLTRVGEPFDLLMHYGDAPDRPGWYSRAVLQVPVCLRTSPAWLKAHGRPTRLEDLRGHPLLLWRAPGAPPVPPELQDVVGPPWIETANLALLYDLAALGAGVLLAPVVPPVFAAPGAGLSTILDDEVRSTVTVRMLSLRPSRADPRVRAMLENIDALLAGVGR